MVGAGVSQLQVERILPDDATPDSIRRLRSENASSSETSSLWRS
jgi:hypothetical protein